MEDLRYTFENAFASITYEPAPTCLVFTYKRFGTSAEFRNAWMVAGELAASRKIHKWIANSLKMEVVRPDDQDWFVRVMGPLLRPHSEQKAYFAVVISESAFAKVSVMNMARAIGKQYSVVFKYFESETKAMEWLRSLS